MSAHREALLVRHCESAGQAPDSALTEGGRAQAAALATALGPRAIDVVVSSPYRRARASAEPLCARAKVGLEADARLQEWELPRIPPEQWPDALRPILRSEIPLAPEVEPLRMARERGVAVLREALAEHRCSVLVTHGKLLALVLSALDGRDPFDVFVALRHGHVFAVRASASGTEVSALWYPP